MSPPNPPVIDPQKAIRVRPRRWHERLWSIYAAIVFLAAVMYGPRNPFRSEASPSDGWDFRLLGVVVFAGFLVIVVTRTPARFVRRVTWLSAFASLMLHLGLTMLAARYWILGLPGSTMARAALSRVEQPLVVTLTPRFERPEPSEWRNPSDPELPRPRADALVPVPAMPASLPPTARAGAPSGLAKSLASLPSRPATADINPPTRLRVVPPAMASATPSPTLDASAEIARRRAWVAAPAARPVPTRRHRGPTPLLSSLPRAPSPPAMTTNRSVATNVCGSVATWHAVHPASGVTKRELGDGREDGHVTGLAPVRYVPDPVAMGTGDTAVEVAIPRSQAGGAGPLGRSLVASRPHPLPAGDLWNPFAARTNRRAAARNSNSPGSATSTDAAIDRGLAFLARMQQEDGHWNLALPDHAAAASEPVPRIQSRTAATGLALLAFFGAGQDHQNSSYYQRIGRGLAYLIRHQAASGDLYIPEDHVSNQNAALYSHAIATLALTEAFGMTRDPRLREPTQKALAYVVSSQHPQLGGWRYAPGVSADTSVSGWMVMALRSGELSGFPIPASTAQGVDRWLEAARESEAVRYRFRYNPTAPDTPSQRHGRLPSASMTSVGLLMALYRGARRSDPTMEAGSQELLAAALPEHSADAKFRDAYFRFYATQVMYYVGDAPWFEWDGRIRPMLLESQVSHGPLAGSWNPHTPIPDRWGNHAGRLYLTTLNLLTLEVEYRHLPLYEDLGW